MLTTLGQPSSSQFDDKIVTVVDAMGRTAAGQPIPPGRISAFADRRRPAPRGADRRRGPLRPGLDGDLLRDGLPVPATRARRPSMHQIALVMAAVGSVGFGIGRAVSEVARYIGAHNFVDAADKTNSAAADALSPTATLVGQLIWETSRWRSASR
jgi:hypothetical protein